MEYTIEPNGTCCGLIPVVSQDQIDGIINGTHPFHQKMRVANLFSKVAITLQHVIKPCVPADWRIDFVTRDITFQKQDFYIEFEEDQDRLEYIIKQALDLIQIYSNKPHMD